MPSRAVIVAIVLFWLAMAGWWFVRDVWPRWTLDDPPVYQIDLVDQFGETVVVWKMWSDDGKSKLKVGDATTRVNPQGPGLFEMKSKLDFTLHEKQEDYRPLVFFGAELRGIDSGVQVTAAGELKSSWCKFSVRHLVLGDFKAEMQAELKDGLMHPSVTTSLGGALPGLAPFAPPTQSSMLNPTLPSHRMRGLSAGKRWRIQLVNPLAGNPLTQPFGIDELEAQTTDDEIDWHDEATPCIRLDTRKPGERAILSRTWVRQSDGLVIQMQVNMQLSNLILIRNHVKP